MKSEFLEILKEELNSAKLDVSVTQGLIDSKSSTTEASNALVVRLMDQKRSVERIERVIAAYEKAAKLGKE